MSDSTHTEGPFSHGFNLLANFESRDGLRTPVLLLEDEYNRARACWNACDGIDTDALEVTPDINDLYDGVVNERNALRAEVERLRGALIEALPVIDQLRQAATYTVMACSMTEAINGKRMLSIHDQSVKRHVEALRAAMKGGA